MLPGKKIDATFILQAFRRRVWLITIPPVLALFAALVYSSTQSDIYLAEMLIAIDPQRVPDAFVRSTVTLGAEQRLEALKVQVLSRTALEQMIQEFDLYPEERASMLLEDVVAKLRKNVTSPKGTTERALAVLMQPEAWPALMSKAIAAATDRSRELGG